MRYDLREWEMPSMLRDIRGTAVRRALRLFRLQLTFKNPALMLVRVFRAGVRERQEEG
jgi:hypothetical protein